MKKKIISIICGIILVLSMFSFVGCGKQSGAKLYSGVDKEEVALYANAGDFYVDEETCELYKYSEEGWVLIGTLKGEQGIQGEQGANGIDGINGADGQNGKDGVDGVDGVDGADGKDGVDGVSVVNVEVSYEYDTYGQVYCVFTFYYSNETTTVSKVLIPEKCFVDSEDDLRNVIETAENGDVIKLVSDIVVESDTAFTVDKEITIELNGHSISAPNDINGNGVFYVVSGGKLTINGDGCIDGVNKTDYAMAIWADGGEVIINGGTYGNIDAGTDNQYDLIYVKNGGRVEINGGIFICKTPKWTLNIHDTNGGEIVVKGGYFVCYNPAKAESENPMANFVADGYEAIEFVEENGMWYTVVQQAQ